MNSLWLHYPGIIRFTRVKNGDHYPQTALIKVLMMQKSPESNSTIQATHSMKSSQNEESLYDIFLVLLIKVDIFLTSSSVKTKLISYYTPLPHQHNRAIIQNTLVSLYIKKSMAFYHLYIS